MTQKILKIAFFFSFFRNVHLWDTDYMTNYDRFLEKVKEDETSFRPLGEKVHEYSLNDGKDQFEIYKVKKKKKKIRWCGACSMCSTHTDVLLTHLYCKSHHSAVRSSERITSACNFSCFCTLRAPATLTPKMTNGTFTRCK